MCAVDKMTSGQFSFLPIGSGDYMDEIRQVLQIIEKSGLENEVGLLSTTVKGKSEKVLKLISEIYEAMDGRCDFTLDVKLSNLCGCK